MASGGRKERRVADGQAEDPELSLVAGEIMDTARSAAQISEATGIPLTRVRRRLREMREEGKVETLMRQSRRGAVENFHFAPDGLNRDAEAWAKMSVDEKRKLFGNMLKIVLTELSRALVTHPTNRGLERLDSEIMRFPMVTDEAGWKEMGDMHREFRDRILATRERIEARVRESGEEGFKATSLVMFFEAETTD